MRLPRSNQPRLFVIAVGAVRTLAACGGFASTSEPTGSTLPPPPDVAELDPAADNKVNLHNMSLAASPILLWMYSPH